MAVKLAISSQRRTRRPQSESKGPPPRRGIDFAEREMAGTMEDDNGDFYLRYCIGHKGIFGHEFLEFEFRPDGKLRYANNSNYKNETMIRKEVFLTPAVLRDCRRIVAESEVTLSDVLYLNIVAFYVRFLAKLVDTLILRFDLGHANYN